MSTQPGAGTEPSEITLSDRDIAAAQELLGQASAELPLPVLTDEEIVALDGLDHPQAVALPWLSAHEDQRELACNVALRTLLSKGFVVPVADVPSQAPNRIGADLELTGVMTLRRSGQKVVVAELNKAGDEKTWLYGYLHGDVALLELVDPEGSHAFSFCPVSELAQSILELAGTTGIQGTDAEAENLDEAGFTARASAELSDVRGVTTVVVIDSASDDTGNVTIYTAPERLYALSASEEDGQARFQLGQVSAETLATRLTGLITAHGEA
ncbi:hypothetical protein [Arthrobacter sp. NPDC090010]|uniref:hypothetical protein n=1 Tax=Arthrobacter sp. NPDC090010 TaxID=3363942 RepID=UPI0038217612